MELDVLNLYSKYDAELRHLAFALRDKYHEMQRRGYGTTFGDVEGELMYMIVREMKPDRAFEISPNAGWSTNYILAALTANEKGTLHSFELLTELNGRPTAAVIRENQHPDWDQQRLDIHIGDARETVPRVDGSIDFLLLDSCHEEWFARWYAAQVFPRVEGVVMVQDIAFSDRLEGTSEAAFMWQWAEQQKAPLKIVGAVEHEIRCGSARAGYAERRGLRSNSVYFRLPIKKEGRLPQLSSSPEEWLAKARSAFSDGDRAEADRWLNQAVAHVMGMTERVNRHRLLLKSAKLFAEMELADEASRCCERALGLVMQSDPLQRRKALSELFDWYCKHGHWRLAAQTGAHMSLEPTMGHTLLRQVRSQLLSRLR